MVNAIGLYPSIVAFLAHIYKVGGFCDRLHNTAVKRYTSTNTKLRLCLI